MFFRPDPSTSLTLAMVDFLGVIDPQPTLHELHAALGLGTFVCAVPATIDAATWSQYGRDICLAETAPVFGLTIERITFDSGSNPAEAFQSAQTAIGKALDDGATVLAWGGWPAEHNLAWGIVRESAPTRPPKGTVFHPGALGGDRSEQVMSTAPRALYAVTGTPNAPERIDGLRIALTHSLQTTKPQPTAHAGLLCGTGAFDFWVNQLRTRRTAGPVSPTFARGHQQFAASIVAGHHLAALYFDSCVGQFGDTVDARLRAVSASARQVCMLLAHSADLNTLKMMFAIEEGRKKMMSELADAKRALQNIPTMLAQALDALPA